MRTIRAAFGGAINDVVLAAVSGGYRDLLISRVNRVSTLLYDLPVQVADPVERLDLVHEQMTELKASHMAEAGEAVTAVGNLAPPMVVGPLSRLAIRAMQQLPNARSTPSPPTSPEFCNRLATAAALTAFAVVAFALGHVAAQLVASQERRGRGGQSRE